MIFEKMIRIPHERIAVLIGKHGAVKSEIEQKCGIVLHVDGETGEVLVKSSPDPALAADSNSENIHKSSTSCDSFDSADDNLKNNHNNNDISTNSDYHTDRDSNLEDKDTHAINDIDLFTPFKAVEIVTAIGRGFAPDVAMTLLRAENSLHVINLVDYAGKSRSNIERIKGRIIGERGRARRNMEQLSGTRISVYGKTVSIIGAGNSLRRAVDAVDAISEGRMHGAVYSRLESANRRQKQEKMILWEKSNIANLSNASGNNNGERVYGSD